MHSESIRNRSQFKTRVQVPDQADLVTQCLAFAPNSVLRQVSPESAPQLPTPTVKTELPPSVTDISHNVNSVDELMSKLMPIEPEVVGFIERETVGQHANTNWHEQRKGRITASHFHDVFTKIETAKLRGHTEFNTASLVNILLRFSTDF